MTVDAIAEIAHPAAVTRVAGAAQARTARDADRGPAKAADKAHVHARKESAVAADLEIDGGKASNQGRLQRP
jgi:hypothetical protein